MCYDNEVWCKIWKGIDLSVHNWHDEFNRFWPEHSKISNICTLNGLLLTEVYNFWDIFEIIFEIIFFFSKVENV